MPKTSKKSKKATYQRFQQERYNLRSRARKLEKVPEQTMMARDFVTELPQLQEVPRPTMEIDFVAEPLQLYEVLMLIQNGLLDTYADDVDSSVAQRETAGSPILDVTEHIYQNAITTHFEEKNINKSLPDEDELPTAWEDITNLKVDIIFEYSAEVLDDIVDEEEAKNAASSKFFKARYSTPRVTKKRSIANKNDPNLK